VTLLPIEPLMPSSNSVQTPLWPPMLSTQNGFDSDRQPIVSSFWYMNFVYILPARSKLPMSPRATPPTSKTPATTPRRRT
jgi:hypothetical protein